jgi:hypothetical protein
MSSVFAARPDLVDSVEYRMGYLAGANLGDGSFVWHSGMEYRRGGPSPFWNVCVAETDRAVVDRCYDEYVSVGE